MKAVVSEMLGALRITKSEVFEVDGRLNSIHYSVALLAGKDELENGFTLNDIEERDDVKRATQHALERTMSTIIKKGIDAGIIPVYNNKRKS